MHSMELTGTIPCAVKVGSTQPYLQAEVWRILLHPCVGGLAFLLLKERKPSQLQGKLKKFGESWSGSGRVEVRNSWV